MSPIEYRQSYRQGKAVRWFVRQRMVALREAGLGVGEIAERVGTTRKTVSKWLRRYAVEGLGGLEEQSRRPKRSPNRTPMEEEEGIVELRKRFPRMGGLRMREEFERGPSGRTLTNIFRRHALMRPRRTKAVKKRDLRKVKERLAAFEQVQVDTKHLTDLPELFPFLRKHRLPKYEYTLRDRATGATFLAFGYECTQTNSAVFVRYVGRHLQREGWCCIASRATTAASLVEPRKEKLPAPSRARPCAGGRSAGPSRWAPKPGTRMWRPSMVWWKTSSFPARLFFLRRSFYQKPTPTCSTSTTNAKTATGGIDPGRP